MDRISKLALCMDIVQTVGCERMNGRGQLSNILPLSHKERDYKPTYRIDTDFQRCSKSELGRGSASSIATRIQVGPAWKAC